VATAQHASHRTLTRSAPHANTAAPRCSEWSRTIYARGRDEDYLVMTRGRLLDRIRVVLAGRAAEEVVLGTPSSYSTGDLRVGAPCLPARRWCILRPPSSCWGSAANRR
jgi:hypothetical protein